MKTLAVRVHALLCLGLATIAFAQAAPTSVAIWPAIAALPPSATQRFVATVSGAANSAVTWSVNGIIGGNATVGTITASGLYTAPAVPAGAIVTATSVADGTQSASASVSITGQLIAGGWGSNGSGQLGNNTFRDSNIPVLASTLANPVEAVAGAGGGNHTLYRKSDGTVWASGWNAYGQLGDGTNVDKGAPVQVSTLTGAAEIASGWYHSLAVKNDGTVSAWGLNSNGQLGNGSTITSNTPVQVTGLTTAVAVAAGADHSAALLNDGTVWTWGFNGNGQLGNGSFIDSNVPVQVTGLTNVVAVACGGYHTLALKSDGTVWAWGFNSHGALGIGTTVTSNVPVQVSGLSGVAAIAGGYLHSIALKGDGSIWTWGYNSNGQLGNGTLNDTLTPAQVPGLSGMTGIAGGGFHTVAVKNDGSAWAWGYNGFGQLGNGSSLDSPSPMRVNNLSTATSVSAGGYHSVMLAVAVPGVFDHLAVTPSTVTPTARVPFSLTVAAQDIFNTPITSYTGTVHFSAVNPDAGAILPADYAFIPADNGSHAFTVTLTTPGVQILNVNDTSAVVKTGAAILVVQSPITVAVSPAAVTLLTGMTQQFAATVTNDPNQAVTWSVNGIAGGDAANGTIDANGLYTAPPTAVFAAIAATSVADPTAVGSAFAIVLSVPAPALVADYQFANTRGSSVGEVPPLADIGAGANTFTVENVQGNNQPVLLFPVGNGVQLNPTTGVFANAVYTISALFRFDSVTGYRRILDFKNAGSDDGLYNLNGTLTFYPVQGGQGTVIPAGAYVHVVLTRAADATVVGYVNGVQQFSFVDSGGLAIIGTDNTLRFFKDDNQVGGENSSGAVARIRIWNAALSASEVLALEPAQTADLALSVAPASGGAIVSVANNGPGTATNVVLTDTLNRVTYTGSVASQGPGCSLSGAVVTCPLGTIAAGAHANVTINVVAAAQGWTSQALRAVSDVPDPNLTNNLARLPANNAPVADAGAAQVLAGLNPAGAAVKLDAGASFDPEGDALTYRWAGPFPEGNGVITGVRPTVTLPLGVSTVTLIVNDGKVDSAPAAVSITVSDFTLTAGAPLAPLKRGQSTTLTLNVAPKYAAYGAPVSLSCPNLPAGFTCSFTPASIVPGATGAAVTVTISASAIAASNSQHARPQLPLFAFWCFAPFGFVCAAGLKRRRAASALLLLLLIALAACGGGGATNTAATTSASSFASTTTITISGASSNLHHSLDVPLSVQ